MELNQPGRKVAANLSANFFLPNPLHFICPAFRSIIVLALFVTGAYAQLAVDRHGKLLKDGQNYRAVGVNYFDSFVRTLFNESDTSYEAGFKVLAEKGIPFARFCATAYWPREFKLYQEDRAGYFRRMDGVVKSAERHGIGLIPSLFWFYACVPDIVGESIDQWGNPQSKTHALMREYVKDLVTRYKDSPAIWAWEFGNEFNLGADLPNAADHRAAVHPKLGTAATRSERDDLTYDMVTIAFSAFAAEVRKVDPVRPISNGNSSLRASAWNNRADRTWTKDSPEQTAKMIALTTPDPVNLVSIHCYDENLANIPAMAAIASGLKKPLFVGEFQIPKPDCVESRERLEEFLLTLEAHRVSLAAIWVFDFTFQETDFNISPANARAWQLDVIGAANRRVQAAAR